MLIPAPCRDPRHEVLFDAAFGGSPERAAVELPTAPDAYGHWYRAVALAGQGYYAAARGELRRVHAAGADPALRSLAASTMGSLARQLGGHAAAAVLDGRAALLVAPLESGGTEPATERAEAPTGESPHARVREARCDALVGLAADALGAGRLDLADRLLARADLQDGHAPGWRVSIRWHWVNAETALARGRSEAAMAHAEAAFAAAEQTRSVRHQVKSRLLVAAAFAAASDRRQAIAHAEVVDELSRAHGLLPLRWACAMLRAGSGVPGADDESAAYALVIGSRGGRFRSSGRP